MIRIQFQMKPCSNRRQHQDHLHHGRPGASTGVSGVGVNCDDTYCYLACSFGITYALRPTPFALTIALFQQVRVDAGFAVGDKSGADCRLIKLNRASAADDSVDVTKLTQSPERGN